MLFGPVRRHEVMKRKGLSKLAYLAEKRRRGRSRIKWKQTVKNGDTKQTVVSRCCERRYALKGAVMTTTISTGNLTILFLLFRRCGQDNTF